MRVQKKADLIYLDFRHALDCRLPDPYVTGVLQAYKKAIDAYWELIDRALTAAGVRRS